MSINKKNIYKLIAENIPNTVCKFFDKDLKIILVVGSKNTELALGVKKEDILGKTIYEAFPPEYAHLHSVFWKKAVQGVYNSFEADYNGRDWNYQFIPVRDDNDVLVGGMSIRQDITNTRKRLNTLERKHNHIVKIAWVTSHNLRAPLARLMGLFNILKTEHSTTENKEVISYIEASMSELDDMVKKIDELANLDVYIEE